MILFIERMKSHLFVYLIGWSLVFVFLVALVALNYFPGDKVHIAPSQRATYEPLRDYAGLAGSSKRRTAFNESDFSDTLNKKFDVAIKRLNKLKEHVDNSRLAKLKQYCAEEVQNCRPGKPCRYRTKVDFRIIPIVYNRAKSLQNCLDSIRELDTLGHKVAVNIWVDRSNTSKVDWDTVNEGWQFALEWKKGTACVHIQRKHVYITGQWIDTWSPPNKHELALILEDDVSISPHAYHYLRAAHDYYKDWRNVSGYTLGMDGVTFFAPVDNRRPMFGPATDVAYMYPVIGTTGFMPQARSWRKFQKWYHNVRSSQADIKPYVPGIIPTEWYMMFEAQGRQESMWEMWHIYYTYLNNEWCVYPNLQTYANEYYNIQLAVNRQEAGLHFNADETRDTTDTLMTDWNEQYIKFPRRTVMYSYDGNDQNAAL